jgi:tRNA 2-thiouridine synthesizing protein A
LSLKADKQLNYLGLYCPVPVLKTKVELEKIAVGQTLEIVADDPAAESDLQSLARSTGQEVLAIQKKGKEIHVFMKKNK